MRTPSFRAVPILAIALTSWSAALWARPLAPPGLRAGVAGKGGADCPDGLVLDDGTAETGYGWVPSVPEGEYVQRILSTQLPTRRLEAVCVCWLRTAGDGEVDFEVVFYGDDGGGPAATPYAAVTASAEVLPVGIAESFFEIDVGAVGIPRGASYVGVRWDPSTDQFFFLCADTSDGTQPVEVFFRDEEAEGAWASVFATVDPIFDEHRALMVRVRASPETALDVPALGAAGLVLLVVLLAAAAVLLMKRRGIEPPG